MKHIITLSILVTFTPFLSAAKKKTVFNFLSEIHHKALSRALSNGYDYSIPIKNIINQSEEKAEFVLSEDKQFLEIQTQGGTGGNVRQFAVFSDGKKEYFVITREYGADMSNENFLVILTKKGRTWVDVTSLVMPKVTLESFSDTPDDIDKQNHLRHFGRISYSIAKDRSKITAHSSISWYEWRNTGRSSNHPHDKSDKAGYETLKPLKYDTIEFIWSPEEKRFIAGKRIERVERCIFDCKANGRQQNLPAALPAVLWLLGCSALRAKDAFVAQAGRLFCALPRGAPGTFGDTKRLF